jgi:hypothetical protein
MDLPRFLMGKVTSAGPGLIELCPDEYDMARIDQMLDEALAECEQLVLGATDQAIRAGSAAK